MKNNFRTMHLQDLANFETRCTSLLPYWVKGSMHL